MITTMLSRRALRARHANPPQFRIVEVAPTMSHTLVIKQGSRAAYLRFEVPITIRELMDYLAGQRGWKFDLNALAVTVDGRDVRSKDVECFLLQPTPGTADPTPCNSTVEFIARVSAKG